MLRRTQQGLSDNEGFHEPSLQLLLRGLGQHAVGSSCLEASREQKLACSVSEGSSDLSFPLGMHHTATDQTFHSRISSQASCGHIQECLKCGIRTDTTQAPCGIHPKTPAHNSQHYWVPLPVPSSLPQSSTHCSGHKDAGAQQVAHLHNCLTQRAEKGKSRFRSCSTCVRDFRSLWSISWTDYISQPHLTCSFWNVLGDAA